MRLTILIPCLLTLITVVTLTQCSASAQSLNGYKPTEFAHNVGSLQDDPGVDLCIVISTKANLREGPSATSAVIRQLKRGEVLALVSRSAVGPWYHVIHIESSLDGWINGGTIRVKYTEKKNAGPVFQERETGTTENPRVEITNDSDHTLYLKVGDNDRIVISPHATKTIFEEPGTYKFYASSPGVIPAFGEHEFRVGITYEWTFYIVTTVR